MSNRKPEVNRFLVWRAHKHLTKELGRTPTSVEIIDFTGDLSETSVKRILHNIGLTVRKTGGLGCNEEYGLHDTGNPHIHIKDVCELMK